MSFLETPLNPAPHPLCVHFATPVVGAPVDAGGEGVEAGGSVNTKGGRSVAGKGRMSNEIVGAISDAVLWSRPAEREMWSTIGDHSPGKVAKCFVVFVTMTSDRSSDGVWGR